MLHEDAKSLNEDESIQKQPQEEAPDRSAEEARILMHLRAAEANKMYTYITHPTL